VLPIIAVLMVYAMTPGALELTENAVHLVRHADTAHADGDHAEDSDRDEHGCSGTYHACTCHSSPHFVDNSVAPRAAAPLPAPTVRLPVIVAPVDSGFARDIDRPPRV
jgi:hypothetical protein